VKTNRTKFKENPNFLHFKTFQPLILVESSINPCPVTRKRNKNQTLDAPFSQKKRMQTVWGNPYLVQKKKKKEKKQYSNSTQHENKD